MKQIDFLALQTMAEALVTEFHNRRVDVLNKTKLKDILKRKNPYLYHAKSIATGEHLVRAILDAWLSSQEEALFGTVLEQLVIYVAGQVFGGTKSSSEGIDLQFVRDQRLYLISVKSGPNWGNNSQIRKMEDNFKKAIRILGTNASSSGNQIPIVCVNGCCYGSSRISDRGTYKKICGRAFWELISCSATMYLDIVKPLGYRAKEKNEVFLEQYSLAVNRFCREVLTDFCEDDGRLKWDKILMLTSG